MSYQDVKNARERQKIRIVWVMGEKCQVCGYKKCHQAMDLHHINPEEKDFAIGFNTNRGWEKTKEELKKCILLCSNCHREFHCGFLKEIPQTSSYIPERAEQISQEIEDIKKHKIYYCKYCGKEVFKGNDCCPNCANILSRKVERPNREILKQEIRQETFVSLGKKYGVTDNSIRKWCKSYNLPFRKNEINQISDQDWELL